MKELTTKYIFGSGVVTLGRGKGAKILSTIPTESPVIENEVKWQNLLGEWNEDRREEIALNLIIYGKEWFEGNSDPPFQFQSHLDPVFVKTDQRLIRYLNTSSYYLSSALLHLRNLLRSYAKLTTVVGPKLPFCEEKTQLIFHVPSPDCYTHFDSCLIALRAFADSIRFTVWKALERDCGLPRNISSLLKTELPETLSECLSQYVNGTLDEIIRYRDNAMHYAPLAVIDNTRLIWSMKIIHAEIWLPVNPEARAHDKLKFPEQKDAYRYAKTLVEKTIEFADAFYSEIGKILGSRNVSISTEI
jgi:hypothetical protein